MEEDDIVEGKKELLVLISSGLMSKLIEREEEWVDCPLDDIVEGLLIQGFAFGEMRFSNGYIRLSTVTSLIRDLVSNIKREIVDEDKVLEAVGVGEHAETRV